MLKLLQSQPGELWLLSSLVSSGGNDIGNENRTPSFEGLGKASNEISSSPSAASVFPLERKRGFVTCLHHFHGEEVERGCSLWSRLRKCYFFSVCALFARLSFDGGCSLFASRRRHANIFVWGNLFLQTCGYQAEECGLGASAFFLFGQQPCIVENNCIAAL